MHLRSLLAAAAAASVLLALSGCGLVGGVAAAQSAGTPDRLPVGASAELGPDDGFIPVGESVALTDDVPAVTQLDSRLRDALQRAAEAAAASDVRFTLVDGWRSARYQQYLFDQAVAQYGSVDEAARWVKQPDQSKHVLGEAVDIATADAMDWLNRFGGEFGLCQIYANEAWHFELAADDTGTCPPQLTDGSAG
ncbi:M15 family metallopeptidase [Herbiconiux ginsengi]|uniref:D-alanyl-D-alanine carboxypeptidase n=1 Tax=Herbiconiux ginsengi TaxID=381665 RepID=A0A1H3S1D0_9MICO|nr:M15 family metallopeptidase [Herbiconiux ginsengi]SDZ30979.1 D-alanyl-D-alanine carboxypeptidase [Herbiconiux ginsengi]